MAAKDAIVAIGITKSFASLRFTMGRQTTKEHIRQTVEALRESTGA